MQSFLYYCGNGDGIRLSRTTEVGATLAVSGLDQGAAIISSNTTAPFTAVMFFDWKVLAETTNVFAPSRYSAGLELYSFEIGFLAKRNY
jgi:hypothetical protein